MKYVYITLIGFFLFSCSYEIPEDFYTNLQVENIDKNQIINKTTNEFYQKVTEICLEELDIIGVNVVIQPLDEFTKNEHKKNGETIDAHLRYFGDYYVLFINEDSRKNIERIISHELIHLSQYNSGRLSYENEKIIWLGEEFEVEEIEYPERPWEIEAFDSEVSMARKIKSRLN